MDEEPWDAPLREREQWLEDQTNPPELSLTVRRSEGPPWRRAPQAAKRVLGEESTGSDRARTAAGREDATDTARDSWENTLPDGRSGPWHHVPVPRGQRNVVYEESSGEEDEVSETVIVDGGGRIEGPIFHPILDIGVYIPGDEIVIIQRPDDTNDGGWGGDGGGTGPDGWGWWDAGELTPKQHRCCECLQAANPGDHNNAEDKRQIWLQFCSTIIDPVLHEKCKRYGTTGTRPAERENWCFYDNSICEDANRPKCPDFL
jgi:hypothetical protein